MAALSFSLTFAGVPFVSDKAQAFRMPAPSLLQGFTTPPQGPPLDQQPDPDLYEEINRILPMIWLQDFSPPTFYPGRNVSALARLDQPSLTPNATIRVGEWFYPTGASRWSVFRGLATSSMVKAMLAVTKGNQPASFMMSSNPISPNNLNNNAANYTVTTNMYMLPARPLGETAGTLDGLYLVTLVDDRYYLQDDALPPLQINQNTTWQSLINTIASVLNLTITNTAISSAYGQPEPDSQLWCNLENAPVLLDAIAYNIGRTVVRNLNGTYTLQTPREAAAVVIQNRPSAASTVRLAGGDIFSPGTPPLNLPVGNLQPARNAVLPAAVNVTFPKYIIGDDPVPHFMNSRGGNQRPSAWYEDSYGDVYIQQVPLASGNVSGAPANSGLTGVGTTATAVRTTAKALYSGEVYAASGMIPLNGSGLNALAQQIAQDYYYQQVIVGLDEVYPGTFLWTPESLNDIIWTYCDRNRLASTRVMHAPWNQNVNDTQQSALPLSGMTGVPRGVGGHTVAQSWKGGNSGLVSVNLAQTFGAGDAIAVVNKVSCLPTQNRWKGTIDQEVILFEGTSGGLLAGAGFGISVVYRGIDGTLAASHANTTAVTWPEYDSIYGVNYLYAEKGQFIAPGDWTSGGLLGAHIIPQTQTVQVQCNSGVQLAGVPHYSGVVHLFDTARASGFQFVGQESVWIVERNGQVVSSGQSYDGQLMSYSLSGPTAPVYLINNFQQVVASGTGSVPSGIVLCVQPIFTDTSGQLTGYDIQGGSLGSGLFMFGSVTSGVVSSGSLGPFMLSSGIILDGGTV